MIKYFKTVLALILATTMLSSCAYTKSSNSDNISIISQNSNSQKNMGEMRNLTSQQIVSEMKLGWNLGDTLDVCNADRDGDGKIDENSTTVDETLWGNPKATKELFEKLWQDGIRSVRIPITWRDHLNDTNEIDKKWLDRVQEVVDYAYDTGMYVIINIHHDGGDDEKFGAWVRNAQNDYDTFYERYSAIWTQISERFANYSDYLIFESMNEVGFDDLSDNDAYALLNKINQDFVDIIRDSNGNNPKRHLLIAGYWTDVEKTCDSRFKMPTDAENKLILSVHYYTPWEFCTTNIQNNWGTPTEVKTMERLIGKMNSTFVENGTPVIIGEYAASGNDLASCVYFIEKLVKICNDYDIATFYWDNGGQVDRNTYEWRTSSYLKVMQRAISDLDYEVTKY